MLKARQARPAVVDALEVSIGRPWRLAASCRETTAGQGATESSSSDIVNTGFGQAGGFRDCELKPEWTSGAEHGDARTDETDERGRFFQNSAENFSRPHGESCRVTGEIARPGGLGVDDAGFSPGCFLRACAP
jgi:hypothetical protein